jgi:hypothetical protein
MLSGGLPAFRGADLAGFAAGLAFDNLGELIAFRLAIVADHLDHLWQNGRYALN